MISLTRHQRSLISRHISKSNSLKKDRFAFVRRYTTPASNKSSVSDLAKKAFETSKEVTLAILSIFKNYKASRPIKKRIADGDETVTRKEFQLLRQSDYDIRRFVPVVLASVLPFSTVIIVPAIMAFPNIIPKACYIGFIKTKVMEAKLSSRNKAIVDLEQNFNRILTESGHDDAFERVDSLIQAVKEDKPINPSDFLEIVRIFESVLDISELDSLTIRAVSGSLSLTSNIIVPAPIQLYIIKKHLAYISADDLYLKKEGTNELSEEEIVNACIERSLKTEGRTREQMEESLSVWVKFSTMKETPAPMLMALSVLDNKDVGK